MMRRFFPSTIRQGVSNPILQLNPEVVYSVQQVNTSIPSSLRLQRESDASVYDVPYLNGEIDWDAAETWVGVSAYGVRTIYDLSGNGNDMPYTGVEDNFYINASFHLDFANKTINSRSNSAYNISISGFADQFDSWVVGGWYGITNAEANIQNGIGFRSAAETEAFAIGAFQTSVGNHSIRGGIRNSTLGSRATVTVTGEPTDNLINQLFNMRLQYEGLGKINYNNYTKSQSGTATTSVPWVLSNTAFFISRGSTGGNTALANGNCFVKEIIIYKAKNLDSTESEQVNDSINERYFP